ncbi:Cystathionine gamma-synthase [Klebsiella michiganensis]|uniref:Cystathionine gamma-synthase n=1 Tax=Klebsiella michiganensis TaxID=1134687 RepID=A0A7H4MSV8_9ENTR|nr:Cystathionine gamma-synthase [Klebsiella michiganensis]
MQDNIHKGTTAIWGGEAEAFAEGAICVPVFNSVTFNYDDMAEWFDVALGKKAGHIYSRNTNPTVRPLEEKIALLDGGEDATSFFYRYGCNQQHLIFLIKSA